VDPQTSKNPANGMTSACSPYTCDEGAGTCRQSCTQVSDCVAPALCDGTGHCVPPAPGGGAGSGATGGCALARPPGAKGAPWSAAAVVLCGWMLRARRRRRATRKLPPPSADTTPSSRSR
jgi:hypothetical protein